MIRLRGMSCQAGHSFFRDEIIEFKSGYLYKNKKAANYHS